MIVGFPFSLTEVSCEVSAKILEKGVRYVDTQKDEYGNVVHRYEVPTKEIADEMSQLLDVREDVDWVHLLQEDVWDSHFVANVIRHNGLPKDVRLRTLLVKRFRNTDSKRGLPVCYENLCTYAIPFREVYGLDKITRALKKAGIFNGCNLSERLQRAYGEGKLTADEAEAILYAFPVRIRRVVDEEYEKTSFATALFED